MVDNMPTHASNQPRILTVDGKTPVPAPTTQIPSERIAAARAITADGAALLEARDGSAAWARSAYQAALVWWGRDLADQLAIIALNGEQVQA